MPPPINPLVDPTPGTIINAVGATTISGATAALTNIPAVPSPLGRQTVVSSRSLINAYARLNAFVTSAQFWNGQFYSPNYQRTATFRTYGNNGDLQEDCDLYRNYYANPAAIPLSVRNNEGVAEINKLFNRPQSFTGVGEDPTPVPPQDRAIKQPFGNAKGFWRRFPPDWGFTFYSNQQVIESLQEKIRKIQSLPGDAVINFDVKESGDQLRRIRQNTGNITAGPAAWVGNRGLGEIYRYCLPFLRITNRWRNNTKFQFPYIGNSSTNEMQNLFVYRTFFEPSNTTRRWRGNYYEFGNYLQTRIPNDTPPRNNNVVPGIDSVPVPNQINYKGFVLTRQQYQAEKLTQFFVREFTRVYGSFLTRQIQMETCSASPLYRNLSTDARPQNVGRNRLIRPNQYLYNIAREYISSKYYWDPSINRFDLSYLTNP